MNLMLWSAMRMGSRRGASRISWNFPPATPGPVPKRLAVRRWPRTSLPRARPKMIDRTFFSTLMARRRWPTSRAGALARMEESSRTWSRRAPGLPPCNRLSRRTRTPGCQFLRTTSIRAERASPDRMRQSGRRFSCSIIARRTPMRPLRQRW